MKFLSCLYCIVSFFCGRERSESAWVTPMNEVRVASTCEDNVSNVMADETRVNPREFIASVDRGIGEYSLSPVPVYGDFEPLHTRREIYQAVPVIPRNNSVALTGVSSMTRPNSDISLSSQGFMTRMNSDTDSDYERMRSGPFHPDVSGDSSYDRCSDFDDREH